MARLATRAGYLVLAVGAAGPAFARYTPPPAPGFAQESAAPKTVRISGGVMAGYIVSRVNPTYPPEARAAHVEGSVVLAATIGPDGTVKNLQVISGPEELRGAAMDAVKQWIYKPMLLNGQPTTVQTTVTVNFHVGN